VEPGMAMKHPTTRICSHCKDSAKLVSVANGEAFFRPVDGQLRIAFVHTSCVEAWAETLGMPVETLQPALWPAGPSQL